MKTTVELPEPLFELARATAKARGTTLKALIEAGLQHVLRQPVKAPRAAWPDVAFHPPASKAGWQVAPTEWRDLSNDAQ